MRHSTVSFLLRICGSAILLAGFVGAQQASGTDAQSPPTRTAELEMLRQQKAARLQPDEPGSVEYVLDVIKEKRIIERLTSGIAGFRVHLGGLITGSGFALGPEYYRRDLAHNQIRVRASARASLRKFYLMDAGVSFPSLADNHLFWICTASIGITPTSTITAQGQARLEWPQRVRPGGHIVRIIARDQAR
jgi:hypothetical protein